MAAAMLGENTTIVRMGQLQSMKPRWESAVDSLESFYMRSWQVHTYDTPSLRTGDEPIVHWTPGEVLGWRNARVIWFPLDRNHLLAMYSSAQPEVFKSGSPARARLVNELVAQRSLNLLLTHPDDGHLVEALKLDVGRTI